MFTRPAFKAETSQYACPAAGDGSCTLESDMTRKTWLSWWETNALHRVHVLLYLSVCHSNLADRETLVMTSSRRDAPQPSTSLDNLYIITSLSDVSSSDL